MPPTLVRKEINISSDAFDEMTGALNDAGIKLDVNDEFVVKRDISIKGPILYRQVNIRHQVLMEVVKIYKSPVKNDFEINDAEDFVNFLDTVYKYILEGTTPEITLKTETKPKASGWGTAKDKI